MRKRHCYGSCGGFTLIEILLVVAIIGILASVAVVATKGKTKHAAIMATRATIAAISTAIDNYEIDMGVYPGSLQDLLQNSGNTSWQGPYLKGTEPLDGWGRPVQYSKSGDDYKIVSYGPDGTSSGDDITN